MTEQQLEEVVEIISKPGNLFLPDLENSWRKSSQVVSVKSRLQGKRYFRGSSGFLLGGVGKENGKCRGRKGILCR